MIEAPPNFNAALTECVVHYHRAFFSNDWIFSKLGVSLLNTSVYYKTIRGIEKIEKEIMERLSMKRKVYLYYEHVPVSNYLEMRNYKPAEILDNIVAYLKFFYPEKN